ncbi:MAG TPA: preprotein translocase subunit SecG [Burkholderiales bacterium]|nr:preprotein translocase subunit SecG [Burkholderiales bacterium]
MGVWTNVLIVLHVLVALGIIGLVLLQHGKGADMGSGFGGGASGSLFGATGSANFLSRSTAVLAALFFILSLALAYVATNRSAERGGGGVLDNVREEQQAPANDVPKPQAQPQKPAAEAPPAQGAVPGGAATEAPKVPEKQVPQ